MVRFSSEPFPCDICPVTCYALQSPALSCRLRPRRPPNYHRGPTYSGRLQKHFAEIDDYKPGDILSQRSVVELLPKFAEIGWNVTDPTELTDKLLPDGHFVVQQLRNRWDSRMARRIARMSLAYDQLDRVSEEEADGS